MILKVIFTKIINFLFGKTKIFIIIFGWFLLVTGTLFLFNPEKARTALLRQGFALFKGQLLLVVIYLSILVFSVSLKTDITFIRIFLWVIIIAMIKMFFSAKALAYNKLKEKIAKASVRALRIFAACQIAIGILMLILQKRIIL